MKTEQLTVITSIAASGADLNRLRFVGYDGAVCAAGAKALGVCNADTAIGQQAPVGAVGIALVEAGGVIARAAEVAAGAGGKAVTGAGTKTATIDGGAAGNHTVTGILTTDRLVSVLRADVSAGNVVNLIDITSEFTISAADTINNTGGTDTTGDRLVVIYERQGNGRALDAAAADGDVIRVLLK